MINKTRLIRLTQELIRIDSQNPGGTEFKIARFIKRYLENLGLKPKIYEFSKNRSNCIAVLKGKKPALSLAITPHLDTVPAGNKWTIAPFKGLIKKNRLYGLGATDCKSNLAVSLEAIRSLAEDKAMLNYNLIFAATADEECGSALGLEALLKKGILKPDAALVLDADDFSIVVAQKGLMHLKIRLEGRRAHGAYPWLGVNAIDIALEIIKEIKNRRFSYNKNKYLKGPTINIGTIKGGDKVNIVADWCEFELDIRFLPKDSSKKILHSISRIIKNNSSKAKLEIEGIQEPFNIDTKHPLVKYLVQAMKKTGVKPVIEGSEGATTISFFQKCGIPSIATGFGTSGCAHIADEFVEIDNLYKGAQLLEEFLKNYSFI